MNTYAYVDSNPLRWVDPMGLEKIITITEGGGSGLYPASVTVDDTECGCQKFKGQGSSLPNSPVRHNTVKSGTYQGTNTTMKKGKPGIYIGDTPTESGSPKPTATEIFVHCGFTPSNKGSEACPTIRPDQCAEFFKNFGKEEPVTIIIRRSQ